MIETITGIVADAQDGYVVLETGGIGYRINVTQVVTADASGGSRMKLFTSFIIRDDRQYLYGFTTRIERELFDVLLTVSGIGARTALALLGLQADRLIGSIAVGDESMLKKIPGIGAKTASRVILELRDKLGKEFIGQYEAGLDMSIISGGDMSDGSIEALEALEALGIDRLDAMSRIRKARGVLGEDGTMEEIIRVAVSGEGQGKPLR